MKLQWGCADPGRGDRAEAAPPPSDPDRPVQGTFCLAADCGSAQARSNPGAFTACGAGKPVYTSKFLVVPNLVVWVTLFSR